MWRICHRQVGPLLPLRLRPRRGAKPLPRSSSPSATRSATDRPGVRKAGPRASPQGRVGRKAGRAPASCKSAPQRTRCRVRKPLRPTHPRAQSQSILRRLPGRRLQGTATTQMRPSKGCRRRASLPGGKPGPPRALHRVVSSRARPRALNSYGPPPAALLRPPPPRMERTLPPSGARASSGPGVRESTPAAHGGAAQRGGSSPRALRLCVGQPRRSRLRPLPASRAMRLGRRVHGLPCLRLATHWPSLLARTPFRTIRRSYRYNRHGPGCRSCSATEPGQRLGTARRLFSAAGPRQRRCRRASEASSCRAAPASCNGSPARRWLCVSLLPLPIPLWLRAPVTLRARRRRPEWLWREPPRRRLSALWTRPPCRRPGLLRRRLRRCGSLRPCPSQGAAQERPAVRFGRTPAKAPGGARSKGGRRPTSVQAAIRPPDGRRARMRPSRRLIRPGPAGRRRLPLGWKRRLCRRVRRVA